MAPELLYDEPGEFVGSLAVTTEWKLQSELLQESEPCFRSLAETGAVGIWQIDTNDRTLYVNPAMCNILGVEGLDGFNTKPYLEFFTPRGCHTGCATTAEIA